MKLRVTAMAANGIRALVLGATGEVGKQLVQELQNNPTFSHVTLITRRALDVTHDKLEQKLVDFENLDAHKEAFQGAQVAYCCLGTTRAKAGATGFVRVDKDYVNHSARLLKDAGCQHFHLVSSTGANKNSSFLYPKTKGEVEEDLSNLQFPVLSIYRPSILLCEREERRVLEKVAQIVIRGFDWRNKISIRTDTVASAMVTNTLTQLQERNDNDPPKVEILENTDILRLGID